MDQLMSASKFGKNGLSKYFKFYPEDGKRFLQWGALGFLGLGAYQLFMTMAKRNINPCCELKDRVESLNNDPMIRDAFIHLQEYRELDPWAFKMALQNTDRLLFLEEALVSGRVPPVRNDKVLAFSSFRIAVQRLTIFQFTVRDKLGNDHGMCASIFTKKIYEQLQKHLLNVLHICSRFKPEDLIARAKVEVKQALRNYRKNIRPVEPLDKWDHIQPKRRNKKRKKKRSSPEPVPETRGQFAREFFQKKRREINS